MKATQKQRCIGWVWGGFDALHILSYVARCMGAGLLPYASELKLAWEMRIDAEPWVILYFLLQITVGLSIPVSCFLFLTQRRAAKWLAYAQTPFRLVAGISSVSVLFYGFKLIPGYGATMIVAPLLIGETIKCWSLWRVSRA